MKKINNKFASFLAFGLVCVGLQSCVPAKKFEDIFDTYNLWRRLIGVVSDDSIECVMVELAEIGHVAVETTVKLSFDDS